MKILINYIFLFFFLSFSVFAQSADSLNVDDSGSDVIEEPTVISAPSDSITENLKTEENSIKKFSSGEEESNNYSDTLILSFVKANVEQSPDSLYFNILKIANYTKEVVKGELTFSFPEGWSIISMHGNILELNPNDSAFIPVRLAIDKSSIGAISYILNATFKKDDEIFSTNAYISIPGYNRWYMYVNQTVCHFNEYNESVNVKLTLSNKGNVTEVIKLDYRIGQLILIDGIDRFNNVSYVTMPANKDSVIILKVKYNNTLSFNDRHLFQQNWRESSLEIEAQSLNEKQKRSIWFKKLESSYYGKKIGGTSPLNIGVTFMNLLSDSYVKATPQVFGTILFPKNRALYYNVQFFGVPFHNELIQNYNLETQTTFILEYSENNFGVQIGDNLNSFGSMLSLSGRGIVAKYSINNSSKIEAGIMKSRLDFNSYGGHAAYSKSFKKISLKTGFGFHTNNNLNGYNSYSGLLGAGYSFITKHRISVDLLGTNTKYHNLINLSPEASSNDTSVSGLGYRINYSINYSKFKLMAAYSDYSKSYTRSNSGGRVDLKSIYNITDKYKLHLTYNRSKVISLNYPYRFYEPASAFYSNDIARLLLFLPTKSGITYNVGPYLNYYIRKNSDSNTGFITESRMLNPKLYVSANYKISSMRTIGGHFSSGYSYLSLDSGNPLIGYLKMKSKPNYSVGGTYTSRVFRLSVTYNIGSIGDIYSDAYYRINNPSVEIKNKNTESFVIRPSYEKFLFSEKIRFMLYANYVYTIPNERENISINSSLLFNLNRGWSINFSGNMFFNAREDEEKGRMVSKDFNVQLGIRKSFDIQQPRLKHYNLTIVCFKDMNGNKIKDDNEPPLPNIQITFERSIPLVDNDDTENINSAFAQIELISSPDGIVYYKNIPQGAYSIYIKPLFNLKDIYNVNGESQVVKIGSNTTYFIPFSETYKVKGKVTIERDEFSTEGLLYNEGIRITATDTNGESFSVLTDNKGEYTLSVPQAQEYKVKVNQVFGDQFFCERDEYAVHFNGIKVISLDFKFYEKKRKVNFSSSIDELYIFNSLNTSVSKTKLGNEGFKTELDTSQVLRYIDRILDTNEKNANLFPISTVTDEGLVFKIDLYPPTNKRLTKDQVTMPAVVCVEENNLFRYFANTFRSYEDAKGFLEEVQDMGISSAKIVSFKDGKEISLKEAGIENE